MTTTIPANYKPTPKSIDNLKARGIPSEFVERELQYFRIYWEETGGKKKSWEMTFQRWMRTAWAGKAGRDYEEQRHRNQNLAGRGMKTDLFDTMLDKINGSAIRQSATTATAGTDGTKQGTGHSDLRLNPRRGATANPINGSASSVATDDEPQRDRTTYPGQRAATPATANPINGSEHRDTADNVSLRRPSVSDARITPGTRAPGAAAPMDPLEAIEKMKKILESA